MSRYPWKTALFLIAAAIITSPLVIPYAVGLGMIAPGGPPPPQPLLSMLIGGLKENLMFIVPATAIGLWFAPRIGLGAPYLQYWLDGAPRPAQPFRSIIWPAIFWAVLTAIVAFIVDGFFKYAMRVDFPAPEIHARIDVPWWRSVLASFWAPWAEETFDRLFLISLISWLLIKIFRTDGAGRCVALWIAIVATSFFFGWYHLDNERIFANPVPMIVQWRTILIVAPVGLAFGWIYIRRGLEAAILSHFIIDLIVHGVRPLAEGRF